MSVEQLAQRSTAVGAVEAVVLVDANPGQPSTLLGEFVAQAIEVFLACEQLETLRKPLVACADGVGVHAVRPRNATSCRVVEASLGTICSGPKRPVRISGDTIMWLASIAATATGSGSSAG